MQLFGQMSMQFEEWMRGDGLSDSSIEKYVGAIDGPLSTWAKNHGLAATPLRTISDPEQFTQLSDNLASTPEFEQRNTRGHGMYGAALKKYAEFLAASTASLQLVYEEGPYSSELSAMEVAQATEPYNPEGQKDAREKLLREIVRRRGQRTFRANLIRAYESCCAISGCTVLAILEAAHITPYLEPETNAVSNGLLLRADIHTLWDLGLVAIDPMTMKVWVSPSISDAAYQSLGGLVAAQPKNPVFRPSQKALMQQWELATKAA